MTAYLKSIYYFLLIFIINQEYPVLFYSHINVYRRMKEVCIFLKRNTNRIIDYSKDDIN